MKFLRLLFVLMELLRYGSAIKLINETIIYTENMAFPPEQSYLTTTVSSSCECRKLCIEDARCWNYCWTSYAERSICQLSDLQPQNLTRVPSRNSGSGWKISHVFGGYLGEDNFLYFPINTLMNFSEAERHCESKTGFHLGVYKTQIQYNILLNFYAMFDQGIWVDLEPLAAGTNTLAVWGDGTPFNNTEIAWLNLTYTSSDDPFTTTPVKFRFTGSAFFDKPESLGSYLAICQLDPSTV